MWRQVDVQKFAWELYLLKLIMLLKNIFSSVKLVNFNFLPFHKNMCIEIDF